MEQKDYQTRFQDEMQEFEQFSLRRFFEKILDGKLSVKEIYEEAAKLSLQIDAPCYNLLLFSFYEKENQTSGTDQNFFCAGRMRSSTIFSGIRSIFYFV